MDRCDKLESWQQLMQMAQASPALNISQLMSNDENRFEKYSIHHAGLLFDFSKNQINDEVKSTLLQLAKDSGVEYWRDAMFSGELINKTESRAVLHTALRNPSKVESNYPGHSSDQQASAELLRVKAFSQQLRESKLKGYGDNDFTDIVCMGVGGSNLGPELVTEALTATKAHPAFNLHFISSVDALPLTKLLAGLNPAKTLFIISSKTFTTSETMLNAHMAKRWMLDTLPEESVVKHFVAVTVDPKKAAEFGIDSSFCFRIWEWVGGRFSFWSAMGLPIAIKFGYDVFEELLAGAHEMDRHFQTADISQNMPIQMALVGIWNSTFLRMNSLAILPYDQSLHLLPAYLQQAEMESNGKSVDRKGESVNWSTCPIIWGQTGINGQHAFYQLLHQGTVDIACDFIASIEESVPAEAPHHENLLANCFAQTRALMNGVTIEEVSKDLRADGLSEDEIAALAPHKVHPGNRPSNTIMMDRLDAYHLGALVALYEHKIYVQGIIWQIYSFDQWGVELGKNLAKNMLDDVMSKQAVNAYDKSTNGLLNYYKEHKDFDFPKL
jgi:glucose-6-phosphate isomerase